MRIPLIYRALLAGSGLLFGSVWVGSVALAEDRVIDRIEASVNGKLILLSDLRDFRRTARLRAQLDPLFQGTPLSAKGEKISDSEIAQFLVDEKIILQAFPATDSEVDQEIGSILSNNRIDRNALRSTLRTQGYTFEDYFDLIRVGIAKRSLIDREIRTKVTISDDDIRNFYVNKYSKTVEPSRNFRVRLIHVSLKDYKNAAGARSAAGLALAAIRKGESFTEVAKRFSDGPNADGGGDLGVLSEEQMNPLIRAQVRKLRAGEVGEIFGSPKEGYFIVQLVEIVAGEDLRLVRMKEEIRGQLAADEYQRQITLWLERQRQDAVIYVAGTKAKP